MSALQSAMSATYSTAKVTMDDGRVLPLDPGQYVIQGHRSLKVIKVREVKAASGTGHIPTVSARLH